jgi:DNA mismatch repair protein MutH
MSFPVFRYCAILEETWETSGLRALFYEKNFVFVVFQRSGRSLYLKKIIMWQMPLEVLDHGVRQVWQKLYDNLSVGKVVKYIDDNGRYFSYFPSASENPYVHVRPHAQNWNDTFPLPVADKLTGSVCYPKHSFWLNRSYILKIIAKDGQKK